MATNYLARPPVGVSDAPTSMLGFREGWQSFKAGLSKKHIGAYWSAVWDHAWEIWWGAGVIGVICTALTLYYAPSRWILGWVVAFVFLIAGYYTWRPLHVRLTPKFKVDKITAQLTPTNIVDDEKIYLQVVPECLSDAPVEGCHGTLLLVSTWNPATNRWIPTQMNAPLKLGWDYYGHDPLTLEPGIPQRLCVCFWGRGTAIMPTVHPLPSKWLYMLGPGPFKFDIRMRAKDCSPVDFSVTVNLLGRKWDDPEYELIQGNNYGK
jgi:hypothetical protein